MHELLSVDVDRLKQRTERTCHEKSVASGSFHKSFVACSDVMPCSRLGISTLMRARRCVWAVLACLLSAATRWPMPSKSCPFLESCLSRCWWSNVTNGSLASRTSCRNLELCQVNGRQQHE